MVTIVPAGREETRLRCRRAGIEEAACLEYREGTACAGYILYRVDGREARLLALDGGDRLTGDSLVRAALNAAERQGARQAVCRIGDMGELLDGMGFERRGDERRVDIPAFFARPCRGGGD